MTPEEKIIVDNLISEFENLLIEIMGSYKASIGSINNYYFSNFDVEKINELYSKIQKYYLNKEREIKMKSEKISYNG